MKIEIIKVVSSIIIIALICSVQNLLNAKKNRRIRQFPWIIITIILSIVGVVLLTKYYDYSEDQTENELNKLLGEISYFGDLAEEEIEKEIISNPNKYISIEETIQKGSSSSQYNSNSFSNPFFVLSILAKALMSQ